MIPKTHRFHGLGSLNHVYRNGRAVREGALTLKFTAGKRADYRLAVVVSKKVHKSAVVRNRIRRRVYEIMRTIKKDDPSRWPHDMVLTCFDESVATQPAAELRASLEKLLQKAKITTKNTAGP